MRRSSFSRTIYQIEFASRDGEQTWYALNPNQESFRASGRCWQETGIYGTYFSGLAMMALEDVRRNDTKGYAYRLVRRVINQEFSVYKEATWETEPLQ